MEKLGSTSGVRWFSWLVLALLLLCAVAAFGLKTTSARTAFLASHEGVEWVMPGLVKGLENMKPPGPTRVVFERKFKVQPGESELVLGVRVMGDFVVSVDGRKVGASGEGQAAEWRRETKVGLQGVEPGEHVLRVEASQPYGPVALWARVTDKSGRMVLMTDGAWTYSINGSAAGTVRAANDAWMASRFDPDNVAREVAGEPAWLSLGAVVLALVLLAGCVWHARARGTPGLVKPRYGWVAVGIGVVWTVLLVVAMQWVSPTLGYDVAGHLEYVEWLRTKGSLPYAEDGWEMYQPPAYYAIGAALLGVFDVSANSATGLTLMKWLNVGLALATLGLAAFAIRGFMGRRESAQTAALMFVGTAPVAFYLFCYPTNENMCTATAAGVFAALSTLRGRRIDDWWRAAVVGLALGVALLSKATALLLVAPVAAMYGNRALAQWRAGRRGAGLKAAGLLGLAGVVALATCGWYYARVQAKYGKAMVGNWEPASGHVWWQVPGFRTAWDFVPDAGGLAEPMYASFGNVWNGFLSTWAGDSLCGGLEAITTRPGWNYEWMYVSQALCLVAAGLIAVGVRARTRRGVTRVGRMDAGLIVMVAVTLPMMAWMTLSVPYYSLVKAFFGLVMLVPCGVLAARGLEALLGGRLEKRGAWVWFVGVWAVVFVGMFLIVPRSDNKTMGALAKVAQGRVEEAKGELAKVVERAPGDMSARVALAALALEDAGLRGRIPALIDAEGLERSLNDPALLTQPFAARRLHIWAIYRINTGRGEEGLKLAMLAVRASPGMAGLWLDAARWRDQAGDTSGALELLREGIRYSPWNADFQDGAAVMCEKLGQVEEAGAYRGMAAQLRAGTGYRAMPGR